METTDIKEEQILIRITGNDRPGLTASIMEILAKMCIRDRDEPSSQLVRRLVTFCARDAYSSVSTWLVPSCAVNTLSLIHI